MGTGRYRDAKDLPSVTIRGRLADDVRKRLHSVGLSQEAFAEACNVPLRTFKRFEAVNCDSMMMLLKILKVFGRFDGLELLFEEEMPRLEARTLLALEAQLSAHFQKIRSIFVEDFTLLESQKGCVVRSAT